MARIPACAGEVWEPVHPSSTVSFGAARISASARSSQTGRIPPVRFLALWKLPCPADSLAYWPFMTPRAK